MTAAARSRLRDPRRAGRRVNGRHRGRERNFSFRSPGRRAKSSRGVRRAPGRRGRHAAAHTWRGPRRARITERPAAALLAFGLRSRGGGRGGGFAALHLPPWDQRPGCSIPGGCPRRAGLTGDDSRARLQLDLGLLSRFAPGTLALPPPMSKKVCWP